MSANLLGGLSPREFLKQYWQKRPLLVRSAFPGIHPPLSAAELAGLACEEGVESRLIEQTRKAPGWRLRHGPFLHKDFRRLPKSRWTLLVQDVDKHVPEVAEFLEPFRFIPNWRIDDVMISYASDGGSVGPHVDAYDVFLLQAEGMRRWDINSRPQLEHAAPGLDLKQVKPFAPEESWLLMPGDMLYLPPGVAHHGVAFGDCMTYSIGFRAPSQVEMLADFSTLLMEGADTHIHYTDPDLQPATNAGELPLEARARARQMLRQHLRPSDEELDIWFGRFMTEPKPWLKPLPLARRTNAVKLRANLQSGRTLAWHPAVRVAWFSARQACHVFVDGKHHPLSERLSGFAELLGESRKLDGSRLLRLLANQEVESLLLEWLDGGQLEWLR
ncbi:MAG TPA: cupin domain-containing protein [Gammaproteobacteria bacterium]|nr:cupin domain-containing protein [Gammaproteobacteria bacterium]